MKLMASHLQRQKMASKAAQQVQQRKEENILCSIFVAVTNAI